MSTKNTLEAKRLRKEKKVKDRGYPPFYSFNDKNKLVKATKIKAQVVLSPAYLFYMNILNKLGVSV